MHHRLWSVLTGIVEGAAGAGVPSKITSGEGRGLGRDAVMGVAGGACGLRFTEISRAQAWPRSPGQLRSSFGPVSPLEDRNVGQGNRSRSCNSDPGGQQ
jgi:hypothetical protein